uniref:Uncharacterized protein n=1 Tax=viral metagenome TaxID=1070528 RepID=A0A6C0C7M7_9ZZZZ
MLVLLVLLIAVQSAPCGVERTKEVGFLGITFCSSVTNKADCLLTNFLDWNNGNVFPCNWVSGACTTGSTTCKPSCFMNGRTSGSACTNPSDPSSCYSNKYTGGFGNSQMCYFKQDLTCGSQACDFSCPGYNTLFNSCGLVTSQYACERYTLHGNLNGDVRCAWDIGTSTCVAGNVCIKICNGIYPTTSCTSLYNVPCGSYFQTVGTLKYDCTANVTLNGYCTTATSNQCYYPGHPTCSGTYTGNGAVCSSFTTESTCNSKYMWDLVVSGGTYRKCKYFDNSAGTGTPGCMPDRPCAP